MNLGAFSISIAVKDLEKSKTFYEALGFEQFAGSMEHKYLILKNGTTLIGLFEGMFDNNILTFNPKWNSDAQEIDSEDIRTIQQHLQSKGIEINEPIDESSTGPAHLSIVDPDGNVILIDQHC